MREWPARPGRELPPKGLLEQVSISVENALPVTENCGMTLAAVARADGFEVFTHPQPNKEERSLHVVTG